MKRILAKNDEHIQLKLLIDTQEIKKFHLKTTTT